MMPYKYNEHILVIDDDEVNRYIMRKILESAGYVVTESEDALSGLGCAIKHKPHLILLDLVMAEVSGFEFLKKKTTLSGLIHTPVIVTSHLKDSQSVSKAILLGASDYLVKPIEARILLQKILKILHNRQFQTINFPQTSYPTVTVKAISKIISGNETSLLVEAPVKIAPNARLHIESPILSALKCLDSLFRKTSKLAQINLFDQYLNDIALVGLSPTIIEHIRQVMKGWK